MEKKQLSSILDGKVFRIPDYQRGYAWEEKQWNDFVEDIDTLIDDKINSHYTGTIVIFQANTKVTDTYGTKRLEIVDVVDGQQRLTTCSLYLSIILNKLIVLGSSDYSVEVINYLYHGTKTKLQLNNDTASCYYDLITKGNINIEVYSVHQKRIVEAYNYLQGHIESKCSSLGDNQVKYLEDLYDAIIRKLNFSFYAIELESEIGMTFELMNSRGKGLSSLELLKNYFMYWIYRNINETAEKEDFTNIVNKTWKDVFINITKCNGDEDQCLRIVWTLLIDHVRKNWNGYNGFKSDKVIPIRHFIKKSQEETKKLLEKIIKVLSIVSLHYSQIIRPTEENCSTSEYKQLMKIRRAGNIATYLPLLVAARIRFSMNKVEEKEYISLLAAIEKFTYRVFLIEGKRSNAAISSFHSWAWGLYHKNYDINYIVKDILGTINYYSNEDSFRNWLLKETDNWYKVYNRALKYTLYEYELHLLETEGKGVKPKLSWASISDSTIEHILPQNPEKNSKWREAWSKEDIKSYLHDISNLVLTNDNSHYKNFEFEVKKGKPGGGHCYANSDIREERKISEYKNWDKASCDKRRRELVDWIISRWGVKENVAK